MRTRSNQRYASDEIDITGVSQHNLLDELFNMIQQPTPSPGVSSDASPPSSPSVVHPDDDPEVIILDEEDDDIHVTDNGTTPNTSTDSAGPSRRNVRTRRASSSTTRFNRGSSTDRVVQNLVVLSMAMGAVFFFFDLAVTTGTVILGLLRPAWLTFKALEARPRARSRAVQDLRNWQMYWIVVSLLFGIDWTLNMVSFMRVPTMIHHAVTFAIVAWLTRDHAANAAMVYENSIRPFLLKHEDSVDAMGTKLLKKADVFSRSALREMNRAVKPREIRRSVEAVAEEVGRAATEIGQAASAGMERQTTDNRRQRFMRFLR